jgi:hypothetical protein
VREERIGSAETLFRGCGHVAIVLRQAVIVDSARTEANANAKKKKKNAKTNQNTQKPASQANNSN